MKLPLKIGKQGQRRLERVEPLKPYEFDFDTAAAEVKRLLPDNPKLGDLLFEEALRLHYYQLNPHLRSPGIDYSFQQGINNLQNFVNQQKTVAKGDYVYILGAIEQQLPQLLEQSLNRMFSVTIPQGKDRAKFSQNMKKRSDWIFSQLEAIKGLPQEKKKPERIIEKPKKR